MLRSIDVAVEGGGILALLGPSGCGKTTLLRCIAGLERPTSGSIHIGGVEMTAGKGVPAERRKVGMVFQDGALFPHRTVMNNVNYGLARGPDRERKGSRAIRLVGLEDKRDRMPGTLSGGEQQRVALARALAPEPGVVLLDEPFSSLDAALRAQLRDEVRRLLTDVGVTAILVTHDQEEAMSFGDRVAVMNAGVIEQVGTPGRSTRRPRRRGSPVRRRGDPAARDVPRRTADTALGSVAIRPTPAGEGPSCCGRSSSVGAGRRGGRRRSAVLRRRHPLRGRRRRRHDPIVARASGSPRTSWRPRRGDGAPARSRTPGRPVRTDVRRTTSA